MLLQKIEALKELVQALQSDESTVLKIQELSIALYESIELELAVYQQKQLTSGQLTIQLQIINSEIKNEIEKIAQMKAVKRLICKILSQMEVTDAIKEMTKQQEQLHEMLATLNGAIEAKERLEHQFSTPQLEGAPRSAVDKMLFMFASHIKPIVPGVLIVAKVNDDSQDLAVHCTVKEDDGTAFSCVKKADAVLAMKGLFVRLVTALQALPSMPQFACSEPHQNGAFTLYLKPANLAVIQKALCEKSTISTNESMPRHSRASVLVDSLNIFKTMQRSLKSTLKIDTDMTCKGTLNPRDGSLILADAVRTSAGEIKSQVKQWLNSLFSSATVPLTIPESDCQLALNSAVYDVAGDFDVVQASSKFLSGQSLNTYVKDILQLTGQQPQPNLVPTDEDEPDKPRRAK